VARLVGTASAEIAADTGADPAIVFGALHRSVREHLAELMAMSVEFRTN
jgi:hypothetical protein